MHWSSTGDATQRGFLLAWGSEPGIDIGLPAAGAEQAEVGTKVQRGQDLQHLMSHLKICIFLLFD